MAKVWSMSKSRMSDWTPLGPVLVFLTLQSLNNVHGFLGKEAWNPSANQSPVFDHVTRSDQSEARIFVFLWVTLATKNLVGNL